MDRALRNSLTRQVAKLQNHPANVDRDHVTFTGFFDTVVEFEAHIHKLEQAAAKWDDANGCK